MEIGKLFKDSLTYPTKDWNKFLILGVLILVMSIFRILQVLGIALDQYIAAEILLIISSVVSLIFGLIIAGYLLNIIKETILKSDVLPEVNVSRNIMDGIKVVILFIIYSIIPTILTTITVYASGAYKYFMALLLYIMEGRSVATIPPEFFSAMLASFSIVMLVGLISTITFGILFIIGTARLAETNSFGAALNIREIFSDIGEIGWGNFIIWGIIAIIISSIILFVGGLIASIPFIGIIIFFLVFYSYLAIYWSRSIGLIYSESKE